MEENKVEKIEVEVLPSETGNPVENVEQTPENIKDIPVSEEPKNDNKAPEGKKGSWIYTIILLVALVAVGILSITINKCNSGKSASSSSQDYTKYIQESATYKSKLLEIAENYIGFEYGEGTHAPVTELYGYSYDESDLTNAKLLYTVGNDTHAFFIEIEGFKRADGEDYETTIVDSSANNLSKGIEITVREKETGYKVNFENDEAFMDVYGKKNSSLKYVLTKGEAQGDFVISYSFYANGDITLCSVNDYKFNPTTNNFTHNNGKVTVFEKSKEALVYFMFK